MASERIGDMTRGELEAYVLRLVSEHFRQYPHVQKSDVPLTEVWKTMLDHIIETQPDEPSTLTLLPEDCR